jgi:hypothetical protein
LTLPPAARERIAIATPSIARSVGELRRVDARGAARVDHPHRDPGARARRRLGPRHGRESAAEEPRVGQRVALVDLAVAAGRSAPASKSSGRDAKRPGGTSS